MAFLLPNLSSPSLHPQSRDNHHNKPIINQQPSISPPTSLLISPPPPTRPGLSALPKLEPPPSKQQLQSPPIPPPETEDFYVNLGDAVRTLREDLPLIFTKDLNYHIYRDDITFVDPLNTFTGIENYKLIFWALRFHGRIMFREIDLEVLRIWQPSENLILIRWNLRGIPRVPWEAKGQFQGTSRYRLDRSGKIYEHKVDNLAFNFPHTLKPAASVLDLVAACPARPNPMFLWGPVDDVYSYHSSSWVEFYRVVRNTLDSKNQLALHNQLVICSWLV